ncbi:alpha/beta hydrolase [Nocardia sp. NPDC059229]|uniref:alpha/beta hydrolase n=1 Tax=Nocardia sp. NPDC059229 TaxID=3346778 RepID=UPI0036976F42
MTTSKLPVIFIHGLWLHPDSWQPWVVKFAEHGYQAVAPGWPGMPADVEAARSAPESIADHGIEDVDAHYSKIIAELPAKPILVGHSFGGMIAQKLLGEGKAAAAVAIDAAQIKGVLPLPLSALHATLPVFRNPANIHRAVSLTEEQFRYAFGNAISEEETTQLYRRWVVPAPGRPLFEAATANFLPHSPAAVNTDRDPATPLLLIAGGQDHTVPEVITTATLKQYRHSDAPTELLSFPDRGHSLTIDHGWAEIADATLTWLAAQGL